MKHGGEHGLEHNHFRLVPNEEVAGVIDVVQDGWCDWGLRIRRGVSSAGSSWP